MELFTAYIDQSVNDLAQEEKSLAGSDRKDESNLVKIRINVYRSEERRVGKEC